MKRNREFNRVFQAFGKRRIASGFFGKSPGTILLFLLMTPYLVTFLFGNLREGGWDRADGESPHGTGESRFVVSNHTAFGSESIPLEAYVADKLARSMDDGCEMEALKAQAVLIRSGLVASLYEPDGDVRGSRIGIQDTDYGSVPAGEAVREAVSQTAGICLTFEGRPVNGAYFAVSNGSTRNGAELFLEEYPYLKSVPCSRDFLSEDFMSMTNLKESEFNRIWQELAKIRKPQEELIPKEQDRVQDSSLGITLYQDSAGYVLYLQREGEWASGEQFRESFHLSSSCFGIGGEDGEIVITVKGVGHGLGMSQFAAREMAARGMDYVEILDYFFEDVTFTKFE